MEINLKAVPFFGAAVQTLPSTPTSSHPSSKHPVFPPSLPDHVYQNCFGNAAADWNSALQCPSLKFENIWDTNVIKSWNPALFLQDSLPGEAGRRARTQGCSDPRPPTGMRG